AVDCESGASPAVRLGRRDVIPAGDVLRVMVDARGEGASAFAFSVNPAGVQADAIVSGDGDENTAWDAVWTAETSVHARGWRAEFRIAWRVLRCSAATPNLRLQIERIDHLAGETSALVAIPVDAPHYVANFAHITGLTGLRPERVFELRPYVLGRYRPFADP